MDDVTLLAMSEDAMAVSSGKEIYQTACFSCHGHRLEGGTGFDLRDGEWIHGVKTWDARRRPAIWVCVTLAPAAVSLAMSSDAVWCLKAGLAS